MILTFIAPAKFKIQIENNFIKIKGLSGMHYTKCFEVDFT